ncbi:2'-5' RNA ligase family protein [Candidatus Gracilibacteria bacterium]|nr:2'-5' RNA ligase family protein [Candidatus Gracilibacteria bacterium]
MNLEKQKEKLEKNWKKFAPKFGSKNWQEDPNFLYFIEIPLPTELWTDMEKLSYTLEKQSRLTGLWFPPQKMHITLALPARKGSHFQANELRFMEKTLKDIFQKIHVFEVILGNLNCFADVLFREVWDETETLYKLHHEICSCIPFAQDPAYKLENYLPHISLFLGKGDCDFLQNENFIREIKPLKMKIEKIFLGRARNEEGKYERRILKEFVLK